MRGKDALEMLHEHDIYTPKRFISLVGEIDQASVEKAFKNLLFLDTISTDPIVFYINTPGGEVYNGMALYDTVKSCRSHVTMIASGHLMSMGPIIFQAADERLITPNCRIMLHHGAVEVSANHKDFLAAAKDSDELAIRTGEIMLKRIREKKPRYTMKQLDTLLTVDKYMWPAKFVEMGLADKVVGEE